MPGCPPFEGALDDVVPHLTVGQDQPPEVLRDAEMQVQAGRPVEGRATEVLLLAEDEAADRWRRLRRLPLSRR